MRIGVFGGSFDPPHNGHLLLADCCLEQAALDRIRFTPVARQPLKPTGPIATDEDRVAMVRLATGGRPEYEVSTLEIDRGGVSYTADTLAEMQRREPEDSLFFLMGADSLADFGQWLRPEEICRLATLLIVRRQGSPEPDIALLQHVADECGVRRLRYQVVEMPEAPISSTEIRRQIADRKPTWRHSVPTAVLEYISQRDLYAR